MVRSLSPSVSRDSCAETLLKEQLASIAMLSLGFYLHFVFLCVIVNVVTARRLEWLLMVV